MKIAATSARAKIARTLYSLAWVAATPLLVAYLLFRARKQPAYRQHWSERFGWFGKSRGATQPLIWLHAVSVGETRAAQPLVKRLLKLYPDHDILVTNGTPTGRATNRELFGSKGVLRSYLPYDHPFLMRRFLAYYQPRIGIIMETELWPNLVAVGKQAGVPLILANARLSEKSLRKGLRWPALVGPAIDQIDIVLAQTERDASRLALLGRADAIVSGNLKFDAPVPLDMLQLGQEWRNRFGGRQIVLLASSRDGEEERVLTQWLTLSMAKGQRHDDHSDDGGKPILAIVPRHPERFSPVRQLMIATGLRVASRQDLDTDHDLQADLLIGDSMGEMYAYYGASDIVIMGGSLLPFGGQNLIEACASGKPVIVGVNTYNFEEVAEQAIGCGAALRVDGPELAVNCALEQLRQPEHLMAMANAAARFAEDHRGATQKTLLALAKYLEQ